MPDTSSPRPSLWALTEAAGGLDQRFILGETTRVPLAVLAHAGRLDAPAERLAGACVMLRMSDQLGTAIALLELDGLARRIVLCTPDLAPEYLPLAAAAAEADVVVAGWALPEAGRSRRLGARPSHDTEWALFTSGTTGPPKLALHRLDALLGPMARATPAAAAADAVTREGHPPGRGVWGTFYDIRRYGGLQMLLRALVGGGSMALSGAHEAPSDFLARAAAARVTFLSGTPTHWRRALLSPAAAMLAPGNVRLSGEVADQPILDKLRATYPHARICHAFAATEAGVGFEVCDGLVGFPAEWVGMSRGGVELRVADGTLRIRSPRTAERYLGEDAPPLRDAEGFVDTKDLVQLRGDRYHFAGRRDGVINVGGLKVNPEEVEEIVNRHPRVEMSLARGKSSPIIGQVVVVDVVLNGVPPERSEAGILEREILDACRGAVAWYKVPAMVRVVPHLPVTAAGKLLRSA